MKGYEWDNNKREINWKKHGIDFPDAVLVFDDNNRIEKESERNNEKRHITIGQVNDVTLLVVYTNRGKNKRIISARRASKDERNAYEKSK